MSSMWVIDRGGPVFEDRTDRDKTHLINNLFRRNRQGDYDILQLRPGLRLWTEMSTARPGVTISRVLPERLLSGDATRHAPLECLFFGWQPITDTFYRVIPEPGDPPAYAVPDYELEKLFMKESNRYQQPRQWIPEPRVHLFSLLIDHKMAEGLRKIKPVLAPLQVDSSYLVAIDKIGYRVLCGMCANSYCQYVHL